MIRREASQQQKCVLLGVAMTYFSFSGLHIVYRIACLVGFSSDGYEYTIVVKVQASRCRENVLKYLRVRTQQRDLSITAVVRTGVS